MEGGRKKEKEREGEREGGDEGEREWGGRGRGNDVEVRDRRGKRGREA